MRFLASATLCIAFGLAVAASAQAAPLQCGGTKATLGLTIGAVRYPGSSKMHARSLEALAALEDSNDKIAGWLGLDDQAHFWIQFAPKSKLAVLLKGTYAPFSGLMSPMNGPTLTLPPGYHVVQCNEP